MKCFFIDVASRFDIQTEVELTEHNMDELALCQASGERYRIRRGTLNGRDVVIVHVANSWWDKLMSYLPSCCSLRKRFINQLSRNVENDEGVYSKLQSLLVLSQDGRVKQYKVKIPFLSNRDLGRILSCRSGQTTARSEQEWRALYHEAGISHLLYRRSNILFD